MSEPPSSMGRSSTLNLSIGPSCFVKCKGCYNNFGATARRGQLVSRQEIARLVSVAKGLGYRQVTVAGGDPLTHPEILEILGDLKDAGMFVKLDTVGTSLLRPAPEAFYGKSTTMHAIEPSLLFELVDVLGVPLDGSTEKIQRQFREAPDLDEFAGIDEDLLGVPVAWTQTARYSVVADSIKILDMAVMADVETCVNTVVHAGNVLDVPIIAKLLRDHRPDEWQLFEFQATGRLASRNKGRFSLDVVNDTLTLGSRAPIGHLVRLPSQKFEAAVRLAAAAVGDAFEVTWKDASTREGGYLMVNDAGELWVPGTRDQPLPVSIGHIRESTARLTNYLADFSRRANAG